MLKKARLFTSGLLLFALILTNSTSFAINNDNYGDIPQYVKELVQAKENEVSNELPEVKAWEVDLEGMMLD